MKALHILLTTVVLSTTTVLGSQTAPVRFAIVGLVHDHARGFIPSNLEREDVQLVAIVEPDPELAAAYKRDYRLDDRLFYRDLDTMLQAVKPQAVGTFTSTFDHRRVVEACAPRGVHVMMEKPLAVSMQHARAIKAAAERGGINVVVNYETTWYPANHAAYALVHEDKALGDLRKIVVHDGHQGPREIGCSEAFLNWLTDPVLNGGGALTDFGCYGANLITWLMNGRRPTSVFAVTQQIKPDVYPHVDDEATIVLTYPEAQGIIQASWNWPFNRKDMEVYGKTGYALAPDANRLRVRIANGPEKETQAPTLIAPRNDPLSYLAAVVRGEIRPAGLSSLEVNMVVTEILDAARESARTGKRVLLSTAGAAQAAAQSGRDSAPTSDLSAGNTQQRDRKPFWLLAYFRQRYDSRVEIDSQGRTHNVPLPNPMKVEQLHLALSRDGRHWTPLNDNRPVWDHWLRDPFLQRGPDGRWHLLATGGARRGDRTQRGPVCLHAVSQDLVHWEDLQSLPLMQGVRDDTGRPARNIWAPEWFFDSTTGECVMIWSSSFEDAGWRKSRLWFARTRDWNSFTSAKALFHPPYSVIDGTLLEHDGTYYLFHKEEEFGESTGERRAIRLATSDKLEGPYRIHQGPLNKGQIVPTITEGPSIMPDPQKPGWLLLYDYCMTNDYGVSSSPDLLHWTVEQNVTLPPDARHGSLVPLTAIEAERLREKFEVSD